MQFEPRFAATAIGSLPHRDVDEACRLMIDGLPEVPVWPQLPRRSYLENMYTQYLEGFPGVRIDPEKGRTWFQVDESLEAELEAFYRAVIDGDLDRFSVSEDRAAGLAGFLDGKYDRELAGRPLVKGQVTGPISMGLTVTDQDKRASLYNPTLEQVIVKGLTLKGRWQSRELKEAFPDSGVVIFFDEPYLVSVGSALMSVSREQVIGDIRECLEGCGADITGLHCCGNTDWSLVFETGVGIVNFDAYEYLEEFLAYDREIGKHLEGGGVIAWGVVANDERSIDDAADDLVERMEGALEALEMRGIERELVARNSMITPSCGMGSCSVDAAEAAMELNIRVSGILRERYF